MLRDAQDPVVMRVLRSRIFAPKAVARGSGLNVDVVRQIATGLYPHRALTFAKIRRWLHEIKEELP